MGLVFRAREPDPCTLPGAAHLYGRPRSRPNRSRDIRGDAAPPSGSAWRRVSRYSQRCRTFWIPSTVDHASKLPFAVLGRAKPPALELRGKATKDLAVRQTLALQGAMAPRYELFRPLVEKRQ